MKRLFFLIFAALPAFAQQASWVASTGAVTLSSAATKATLQQPAPTAGVPAEQIAVDAAEVRCPAACTITQYQNATTAATATAGTVTGVDPTSNSTFALTFWTASNASGGTTIGVTICDAACTVVLQSPRGPTYPILTMGGGGTAVSYSIGISAVTGDAYIKFTGRRTQ